jgi:selenocysteine-specific elongation factor
VRAGKSGFVHSGVRSSLMDKIRGTLEAYHAEEPLRSGIRRNELLGRLRLPVPAHFYEETLDDMLKEGDLKAEGPFLSVSGHAIRMSDEQEALRKQISRLLEEGGAAPPDLQELPEKVGAEADAVRQVVDAMQAMGDVVRVESLLVFHPGVLAGVEQRVAEYLTNEADLAVSAFRDLVGTTRKYAVPLLNYLDNSGVTERQGDVRVKGPKLRQGVG